MDQSGKGEGTWAGRVLCLVSLVHHSSHIPLRTLNDFRETSFISLNASSSSVELRASL